RKRAAEVEEGQYEQQAQRQPDIQRVDVPPERPRVAARHRPRDLKAGPRFKRATGVIVDDHLPELLLAVAREVADLPLKRDLQVGGGIGAGMLAAQGAHL